MHRILSTLLLGAALAAPVAIRADDEHHEREKARRYYDRNAKDWHEWNEREERAYRRYLEENRLREDRWERANAARQRAYWRWRHNHPDAVVFGDRR